MERFELAIAGMGGQGILLAGRLLAEAGIKRYRHVTFFPNYATLMRGWPSEAITILSNDPIRSPLRRDVSAVILMHPQFLAEYQQRVKPGGLFLLDSTLIKERVTRGDIRTIYLPATEYATDIGSSRIANLVLLGGYLALSGALPLETMEEVLSEGARGRGAEAWERLLPLNKRALREGAHLALKQ